MHCFEQIQKIVLRQDPKWIARLPSATLRILGIKSQGDKESSLSDRQDPNEQLRFFHQSRVVRLMTDLALQLVEVKQDMLPIEVPFDSKSLEILPIQTFIKVLTSSGCLIVRESLLPTEYRPVRIEQIHADCLERLSVGDTWTAMRIVDRYNQVFSIQESARIKGICFALQGHTKIAERYISEWIGCAKLVDQAWGLYSRAMLYARHHDREYISFEKAADDLNLALSILNKCDTNVEVTFSKIFNRNGYALILFRLGAFDEAADILKSGIAAMTDDFTRLNLHKSVLLCNLAQCFVAMGAFKQAEDAYIKLIQIDPCYAENRVEYAKILIELGRPLEAIEQLSVAIENDSSLAVAWGLRGSLLLEVGAYDRAIFDLKKSIRRDQTDVAVKLDLVEALISVKSYTQADIFLNEIDLKAIGDLALTENYFSFRAEVAIGKNEINQAKNWLIRGIQLFPNSDLIRENYITCEAL